MVLIMARPWRNPTSGIYYLRMRIPRPLLAQARGTTVSLPIGTERTTVILSDTVKASLRTHDAGEAKLRYAAAAASLSTHFEALQSGPVQLTKRQIVAIAGTVYADLIGILNDEPGETEIWDNVLRLHSQARTAGKLEQWVGPTVDETLLKLHIIANAESRAALIEEVDRAMVQQAQVLRRFSEGDFRPDPDAARFPDAEAGLAPLKKKSAKKTAPPVKTSPEGTSILDIWNRFQKTAPLPASSTVKRWGPAIKAFAAFIEHRGMETVTSSDAILFSDHRVQAGISATSASKVDLAAVKRMFSFAQARGLIGSNPLAGLRRERRGTEEDREREGRDFKPHEWRLILNRSLTDHEVPGKRSKVILDAIRWVPWICAYSGARPGEAIQLRKEDFGEEDGIAYQFIRNSAGTVKTGKGRKTPLHPHLIEQGLLKFVASASPGHLFLSVAGEGGEKAVATAIDTARGRLGNWVREIGVDDPEISPNHAWRHTFKTIAQDVDLPEKVVDAICGHAPTTQGRKYGTVSLMAKASALAKFPVYKLDEPKPAPTSQP
jgi:integrase